MSKLTLHEWHFWSCIEALYLNRTVAVGKATMAWLYLIATIDVNYTLLMEQCIQHQPG
jgi:hypothetical protein